MILLENQRRTIKHRSLLTCILALIVFTAFYFISAELLSLNKYGDQIAYRLFYDRLAGVPLIQVQAIQISTVGGAEPVYGLLMWAGANAGFSKDGYLSFFNGFFAAVLFILMRKYRVAPVVIALIFCNYYFLVLLTSAERLKFAYIFLTLAANFSGRIRFTFGVLAVISHFQTLLNLVAMFSGSLSINRVFGSIRSVGFSRAFFSFVFIVIVSYLILSKLLPSILEKFNAYSDSNIFEANALLSIALLTVISVMVSRERLHLLMLLAPLMIAVIVIGPDRVNMIAVVVVFYSLLKEGKMDHPLMYPLLGYFTVRGYFYVLNVVNYGDGFASR